VNECVEYLELVSAYADDELTISEKRRVKEHLDTCESCSALLELYREISAAADESIVPAPAELLVGVMEKVRQESKTIRSDNEKRRKIIRLALTRYVPLAACLAVVLLTLPLVIDLIRPAYDMETSPAGAPYGALNSLMASHSAQTEMAMSEDSEEADTAASSRSSAQMYAADNAAGAPIAPGGGSAAASAPNAPVAPAPEAAGGSSGARPSGPAESGSSNESSNMSPPATIVTDPPSMSAGPHDGAQEPGSWGEAWNFPIDDNNREGWDTEDLDDFMPVAVPISAIIEITGELPELLENYAAILIDDFTEHIIIPHETALELISMITGREGVTISINVEDGDYALVVYTRRG